MDYHVSTPEKNKHLLSSPIKKHLAVVLCDQECNCTCSTAKVAESEWRQRSNTRPPRHRQAAAALLTKSHNPQETKQEMVVNSQSMIVWKHVLLLYACQLKWWRHAHMSQHDVTSVRLLYDDTRCWRQLQFNSNTRTRLEHWVLIIARHSSRYTHYFQDNFLQKFEALSWAKALSKRLAE